MIKKFIPSLLIGVSCFSGQLMAQDSTHVIMDEFLEMSFEDLMNVTIVSASREEESAFDAPVSSFVITSQEITLSGATSIPEALRLCPGLIVREISNGTYDVSIRGGIDGSPAYSYSYINTSILVMIDNRPVFSSLQGGTYWQNLPIGLAEIDRIEVVEGPSSPLYGPNAVSGVINIISKSAPKEIGSYMSAVAQGGKNTNLVSVLGGVRAIDKLAIEIGMNYETRQRFDNSFYDPKKLGYVVLDSVTSQNIQDTKELRFREVSQSLRKLGATANIYYDVNEDVKFKLSGNMNHNMGLYPLAAGLTISNFSNTSQGATLTSSIYGFNLQASLLSGIQGLTGNENVNNYNYSNTDLYLDYNIKLWDDKISIRPSISYQSAYANDKEFTTDKGLDGTFNGEGTINNVAGSVKIDAKPIKNLRVILAGRYDKFNYPNTGLFSYQGIANYKLGEKNNIRLLTGKSYNGSFLVPTLINTSTPIAPGMNLNLHGNQNLDLLSNTTYELGFRTKVIGNTIIDIALFNQTFEGFNTLVAHVPVFDFPTKTVNFDFYTENLPLVVKQNGVTISGQASLLNSKIQLRPQFTIQQTQLENYSPYYNEKGAYDNARFFYTLAEHKDSTSNVKGQSTPSIWGGINLIVNPIKNLNISISGYYYNSYVMHMSAEVNNQTGQVIDQEASNIARKFVLNANVSYKLGGGISLFVNARNLLNQASPEGFGSDRLGATYLGGISLNY